MTKLQTVIAIIRFLKMIINYLEKEKGRLEIKVVTIKDDPEGIHHDESDKVDPDNFADKYGLRKPDQR